MQVCTGCNKTKPVEDFPVRNNRKSGLGSRCKDCRSSATRLWYTKNTEKAKLTARERQLKVLYNMTLEDYDLMLRLQGGCCAICGTDSPAGNGRFCVDHNHITGKVRGLLCLHCNSGIGQLKDNEELVESALNYLRSYREATNAAL